MSGPGPLSPEQQAIDLRYMGQALMLGGRGVGATWPNPSVGAVVTRETPAGPVIVGRGYTQPGGRPHGEAMAFDMAEDAAAGGTLYVTLEPCSHRTVRGATPCMERTVLAGITRVVSAMADPNPQIAGLGHALLRAAHIRVTVGVGEAQAQSQHRGHVLRVTQGRPMVTLKLAMTADGYAGGPGRNRLAVSCELASRWVHLQRVHHDAIMLGIASVLVDDPMLNVRLPGLSGRSPVRVILDSALRLPLASNLVRTVADVPVWLIAAEDAPVAPELALVACGVEVMRVSRAADGHLDLHEALQLLAARGITRVFSEGGPTVAEKLALAGLADEIILSCSPRALGAEGVIAVRPGLARMIADPARYMLAESGLIGDDMFNHYRKVS